MTLTIDKAGRVVLPKPVRDRLGLRPGAELELQLEPDGELRLRAKRAEPALARVDGVLVHRGEASAGLDWDGLLERERDERSRALAGGLRR